MYDIFSEFENFFNNFDIYPTYREVEKCPGCNMTYSEFKKSGKLGCPKCYDMFKKPLEITLKQIHQNSKHTGKIPATGAMELKKKRQYEELKQKLQQAVKEENYEEAALLHKQLKALGNIEE